MPVSRAKRTLEEIVNKSDSDDDDYDDHVPRTRKTTSKSKGKSKPSKRRKRDSDDIDDDELDDLGLSSDGEASYESEAEEDAADVERNARGKPRRSAARNRVVYKESSGDELAEEEEEVKPEPATRKKPLILKLTNKSLPPTRARSSRSRSASNGNNVLPTTETQGTRRSARRRKDETEDIYALTGSGNHVETVRRGTRTPDADIVARHRPNEIHASTIEEEDENSNEKLPQNDQEDGADAEPRGSQIEILESDQQPDPEEDEPSGQNATGDTEDVEMEENFAPEPENEAGAQEEEDDDDDDMPIMRRKTRARKQVITEEVNEVSEPAVRRSSRKKPAKKDEGSDFEPDGEEGNDDDMSESEKSQGSPRKRSQQADDDYESSQGRRAGLRKRKSQSRADSEAVEADELAEELAELKPGRRRRRVEPEITYVEKPRRNRKSVDYRIIRPDLALPNEDNEVEAAQSPSRRGRGGGGGWQRSLFSTYGPFGGAGGPPPVLGGPSGAGAAGGVDSDSSDDEAGQRPKGAAGAVGVTPTSALAPGFGLGPSAPAHGGDGLQGGTSGTPANLGKVKDKQALADADPLGVDPTVNFDSVGGLQGHIDQLKEMVSLPLLYPEIFQRFLIVPPRGVLFHGPPGTGKTLLARALASSVSSQGRKVTFYMRKGADALSKWVGEAERQLRLLFEEARKTQPSIIFFDEIDGLAPVRSSKQEQIHSSIVSTLLALMDGMDGRGQVIVIGATNRPDSIDPALRRPGRFDREFYFPLPSAEGRRSILDIHTKGWDPPLSNDIKDELAKITKGYGGADLRALCTEAALNAVQRRYPQIYSSNEKLLIDPKKIEVGPKDFMISVKKMVPSSERSASSGAAPLPKIVEPLLRNPLSEIKNILTEVLPRKKKLTALEEAQFEEPEDASGFRREQMQHEFETSRVFRPRLLIRGSQGMGQQYLAAAVLTYFEGIHVQAFDLPTLISDSTRSPEATVVQLFTEVKRHKPSVIFIPNVQSWYETVGHTVISTFLGLLRSLAPTDPILLLGILEHDGEDVDSDMMRHLFGFSKKNRFELGAPDNDDRREFFNSLVGYIKTSPPDFPDPENRKKRRLETLELAPPPAPKTPTPPTKEEMKAQKRKDHQTLNFLKIRIQPIMDQIKRYKRFRTGVIDETQIRYLYEEEDPNVVTTDLPLEQRTTFRPFEKDTDKHGVPGLREAVSGKFYYNLDIVTIEKRLSNGYYKRPSDFLADIKRLTKDARQLGDQERLLRANELQSNVEVDIGNIEQTEPALVAECQNVYLRELEREKVAIEKAKRNSEEAPLASNVPHGNTDSSNPSFGPVTLGEPFSGPRPGQQPVTPPRPSNLSFMTNGHTDHPKEADGDVHMSNSDDVHGAENNTQNSSFGPSAQPRPPHSYTAPSQHLQRQSGLSSLSQKGTMTPMAPGSQPGDYSNDASTTQTTSDKKNSGPSNPHSFALRHEGPDLTSYPDRVSGDDHLPDTQQGESSYNSTQNHAPLTGIEDFASQHNDTTSSQQYHNPRFNPGTQPPVPPFDAPSRPHQPNNTINSLLNNNDEDKSPGGELIIDHQYIQQLHDQLTQRTSGCSVEQLEQVNTCLMDSVWKMRGEWNRTKVAAQLIDAFNDVLEDMQSLQDIGPVSQRTTRQLGGA
ncbi:hypothetical protein FQN54_003185 [Arachnomyces sp. PD_36]|nr:hypothetical protein FQN54_003185 [Arachnomyces sp. PD_36]